MNKKILYGTIAIVVVIILVVAVLEVIPSASPSITTSASTATATAGQNITFDAFISGGTSSNVTFNFGDGSTGTAMHISGNEYTVKHTYLTAGKYLITATATVNGNNINNLKSINEITVLPATVAPAVATEITLPSIITKTQIITPGSTANMTASTLEPPTAPNWTIGYYIWNFGDGFTQTNYSVFNSSSGNFMLENVTHYYSKAGIYAVTLNVITFNSSTYTSLTYVKNGINYTYYPVSDLPSILSSGSYFNNTYIITIVVNSTAKLIQNTVPLTNPTQITMTEIAALGPYTFDPPLDYETIGEEVILNTYETLLQYNGSSTSQFFPMVATEIPTVANGGISTNYLNYTFNIRSDLKFANGDPLTAWDVYISFVRALLFVMGSPGTPGWIIAQDLLPGGGYAPNLYTNGTALYDNITRAITVDNVSQSVTFHLLKSDPAFLDYVSDPQCGAIMDYNWIVEHGASITFTPAGFLAYTNYSYQSDYNNYLRYNIMGSGPYMIKNYIIGQGISLVPNPYYTPIPGVPGYDHAANDTVYIEWEKDPATALLMAETGQTDILVNLPTYDYQIMQKLYLQGKINISTFTTLEINFFNFNLNINTTLLPELGAGYKVPQYYFTNLNVRKAFAYAFNYTDYIDDLLGNSLYKADFGFNYAGVIPMGMPGYMNTTQLQKAGAVVPTYDLTLAKQYMMQSGEYNTSINIPIMVPAGDPLEYAAAEMWGSALKQIDPYISVSAVYTSSFGSFIASNENPMPIYSWAPDCWTPDYIYPYDNLYAMYTGGYYASGDGVNYTNILAGGYLQEANQYQELLNLTAQGEATGNVTQALHYFDEADVIGINLYLYVYTWQQNGMWMTSPYIHGMQYEDNGLYGGAGMIQYIYLSK